MKHRTVLITTLILLAFLVPRLIGTNAYVNIDGAGYWFERTDRFWHGLATGNLIDTIPAPHPGVTLTWLAGASFRMAHAVGALDKLPTDGDAASQAAALPFAALPTVLVTTLLAGVAFWRFRNETGSLAAAAIAPIFLAVDPWFLSQSRQFHLDALAVAWSFIGLLLTPTERTGRWKLRLVLAGLAFGLGVLTRFSSLLIPGITALYLLWRWRDVSWPNRFRWLGRGAIAAVATVTVLWPVAVVHPFATIATLKRGVGWALREHVDLPYLRSVAPWDGWVQDPLTLLLRTSLVVLVVVGVFLARRRWRNWSDLQRLLGLVAAVSFAVIWATPKSIDRYLLPTVVALDLFAGLALADLWRLRPTLHRGLAGAAIAFVAFSALQTIRLAPFENIARNSLFRIAYPRLVGRSTALQFGWGEGLKEIGLMTGLLSEGRPVTVASWYADALEPFTRANVISLGNAWQAEYVVLYQNQLVRNVYPTIARSILDEGLQPVGSVSFDGYGLAWIYQTPAAVRRAKHPLQKYRAERGNLTTAELRYFLARRAPNHIAIGEWPLLTGGH